MEQMSREGRASWQKGSFVREACEDLDRNGSSSWILETPVIIEMAVLNESVEIEGRKWEENVDWINFVGHCQHEEGRNHQDLNLTF